MCRDAHAKRRYVDAFHSSLNNREQEFQEQMVVRFIKAQFISNFCQVQVILLSPSRSLLFLFFFALFCFLWHLLCFFPSFSVWLFSSGLRSFLVEETPSAAQMIIAELQFHSSDSLRWGTVDFLCIMELQREWEKERSEEKGSVVSVTSFSWCSLCVFVNMPVFSKSVGTLGTFLNESPQRKT